MTPPPLPVTRVTPSRIGNPWNGTPTAGSRWTREQLATLFRRQVNPDTCAEHAVHLRLDRPTMADGLFKRVLCPIVATSKDGLWIRIVQPDGSEAWRAA